MKNIKNLGFKAVWADMPARGSRLIWKAFSVKVLIYASSFYLVLDGKVEGWNAVVLLLVMALIVIFGRDSLKFIKALKGLKETDDWDGIEGGK